MKRKPAIRREDGFWSAFLMIFLVTLGLLGVGAYALVKSEGLNIGTQARTMQAEYALDGAAFFAMKVLAHGNLTAATLARTYSIGAASVTLDTTVDAEGDVHLWVTTVNDDAERELEIETEIIGFRTGAVTTSGTISSITGRDNMFEEDSRLLFPSASSMPTINVAGLTAIATTITGNKSYAAGTRVPATGTFFSAGSTPRVYVVTGNLTLNGNCHLYGIWIVNGTVTMRGTDRIDGVLYMPNVRTFTINSMGSTTEAVIKGGLVTKGTVTGNTSCSIQNWPAYMNAFCSYATNISAAKSYVALWKYR